MSFLIRPIQEKDLDAVFELAKQTGPGMTSLPADKVLLSKKIQESLNGFKIEPLSPGSESYRLIMEYDSEIVGIAGIRAKVGGFEPFYSYEMKQARHESISLKVDKQIPYLELAQEYNGPTIIGSLFLSPTVRGKGLGKYLSRSRFMFMADQMHRFADQVIAEMRGVINTDGKSPFWEGTIRHFFNIEYDQADYLSAKDKGFIAELMPRYPIYIPLLRDEAINVIGEVHPETKAALKFLEDEGFSKDNHVDIFDAGPRVIVDTQEIETIKNSLLVKVKEILEEENNFTDCDEYLISNSKLDIRISKGKVKLSNNNQASISSKLAKQLGVKSNETIRVHKSS
ncbi:MAG: arginine N-succinyltransferase [Candidatus Caenarcaniphilales bacterium]|nr:arginine N-succinyltransferase [Candidatus Caenarcaniphilales bacterium]